MQIPSPYVDPPTTETSFMYERKHADLSKTENSEFINEVPITVYQVSNVYDIRVLRLTYKYNCIIIDIHYYFWVG